MNKQYYFDHAASSFPKPDNVISAMSDFMQNIAISPGHSSHSLAKKSSQVVTEAKETIARFFGIKNIHQLIFTLNATYAINMVLQGFLKAADHVIYTSTEHNSVLRCLNLLTENKNISLSCIPCNSDGMLDLPMIESSITPNTKLIVVNHASNVTGIINPIEKIISIAKKHSIKVAIDAVQTAGFINIDVEQLGCDYLFFTGHKALLGPTGIGGAYIKDIDSVDSIIVGGTGGNSAALFHPISMPEKFEPGTMHAINIAGLAAAIHYIDQIGLNSIREHQVGLTQFFLENLRKIKGVLIYGEQCAEIKTPVVSFNCNGFLASEIAGLLDVKYGILVRSGLQCAPLIHKALHSFPNGTIRVSFGYSNTYEEVEYLIRCLRCLESRDEI